MGCTLYILEAVEFSVKSTEVFPKKPVVCLFKNTCNKPKCYLQKYSNVDLAHLINMKYKYF